MSIHSDSSGSFASVEIHGPKIVASDLKEWIEVLNRSMKEFPEFQEMEIKGNNEQVPCSTFFKGWSRHPSAAFLKSIAFKELMLSQAQLSLFLRSLGNVGLFAIVLDNVEFASDQGLQKVLYKLAVENNLIRALGVNKLKGSVHDAMDGFLFSLFVRNKGELSLPEVVDANSSDDGSIEMIGVVVGSRNAFSRNAYLQVVRSAIRNIPAVEECLEGTRSSANSFTESEKLFLENLTSTSVLGFY